MRIRRIAALAATLNAFIASAESSEPPKRPESVPSEALWAGGADGGSWILCSPVSGRGTFHCKVFDDYLGNPIAGGIFHLYFVGQDGRPLRVENSNDLRFEPRFYDGAVIALEGDLVLLPDSKSYPDER